MKPDRSLAHISLLVPDYDEAIAYYTGVLGFRLLEDAPREEGKRWVLVSPGQGDGCSILLARAATPEQESRVGNQTGGRVFLFLHTDDFWRDYRDFREKGVEFTREPVAEPFGIVSVFVDRYGNKWDLIEPRTETADFPELETAHTIIRQLSVHDLDAFFRLRSEEAVMQYIARPRMTKKEEALDMMHRVNRGNSRGEAYFWGIYWKETGELTGTVCLWNWDKEHFRAELGYALLPEFQRKRLMPEVLPVVIDFAFGPMGLHSIVAQVHPDNEASIKVLEKQGFSRQAYFKEDFYYDGKFLDTVVYCLIRLGTN